MSILTQTILLYHPILLARSRTMSQIPTSKARPSTDYIELAKLHNNRNDLGQMLAALWAKLAFNEFRAGGVTAALGRGWVIDSVDVFHADLYSNRAALVVVAAVLLEGLDVARFNFWGDLIDRGRTRKGFHTFADTLEDCCWIDVAG
jgi:hypothetical protein